MALPVTIPNTFANATSSIPLSQLDTNFSTLANAVNGLNSGSETLANLKATTANVGVLTVTGNATIGDASTDTVTLNSTLTANTAVIFAAGTSAAPSITTTGDTNTGIFFPAADTIAFAEGGAEAMRIDSSGRVGIGTTSPSYKLTVSGDGETISTIGGTTTGSTYLAFRGSTGTRVGYIGPASSGANSDFYIVNEANNAMLFYTNNAERMRIDSSGNVLVGGTSSLGVTGSKIFEVQAGSSQTAYLLNYTPSYSYSGVYNAGDSQTYNFWKSGNNYLFGTVTNPDTSGWTERARITSGGYFKASNNGTYYGATGTWHEFYQTGTDPVLYFNATNAAYESSMLAPIATRAASANFNFFRGFSDSGADTEIILRGDGNGYADGTWNNNGADYAEFFESANGQALTLGATVVLDGNKVREAKDQDPASAIIGVVRPKEPSKASMVIGNTAWNKWANKYLTDDFDRYIMEDHDVVEWEEQVLEREAVVAVEAVVDEEGNEVSPAVPAQEAVYKTKQHSYESHNIPAGVTVPADAVRKTHDDKGNKFQHYKLNPAWDKDTEYVNRENRPEWNIIGLLGQVKILKGQPVGDRWIKMRDVSATVEEWMIR